jgi:hypothetical protein
MKTKQKLKTGNRKSYASADQIRVAMQKILKLQQHALELDDDHAANARLSLKMTSWMQMLMADDVNLTDLHLINEWYDMLRYPIDLLMIEARAAQ